MVSKPNENKSASSGGNKELQIGVLFVDKVSGSQIGFIQFNSSGVLAYKMIKEGLHVFAFRSIEPFIKQWAKEPLYIKYAKLLEEKSKLPDEILMQEANSCANFLNSLESPLKLGSYTVEALRVPITS